jgi:hypothetical protein
MLEDKNNPIPAYSFNFLTQTRALYARIKKLIFLPNICDHQEKNLLFFIFKDKDNSLFLLN